MYKKHKPITIKNNLKRNKIAHFRFYANFGFFLQEYSRNWKKFRKILKRRFPEIASTVNMIFRSPTIKFGLPFLYWSSGKDKNPIRVKNGHRIMAVKKDKEKLILFSSLFLNIDRSAILEY